MKTAIDLTQLFRSAVAWHRFGIPFGTIMLRFYQSGARPPHSKRVEWAQGRQDQLTYGDHEMKILLRGLIGLVIGICYGVLVWIITSYTYMIGVDREHPGPMIPDAVGMARLLALLAGLITGSCGAVAGLVVGLAALKPRNAAWVAGSIGLLVQVLLMLPSLDSSVFRAPRFFLREQLLGLVLLPLGVGVIGLLVSVVVRILKLSQQYR